MQSFAFRIWNSAFRIPHSAFGRSVWLSAWLVLLALLAPAALGQDVKVEKYKLDNGLTVILHEDHTLPMASVNIWYRVGSKDEAKGRSGFAHLFEHLMFMGTFRAPGADFDNLMEVGGGWNNASTAEDRTNYFEVGPSMLLPTLLWLEADRMEDLAHAMSQEKLEKQRAVVRNERRQSYENQPYGKSELKVYEWMFPEGHPYHIPVIGTHEDLEAATLEDVKNFFGMYYVPPNASLVVAGDFKPDEIKPMIAQLFGTLPKGAEPQHRTAEPVKLASVKRETMTDTVQFARTTMVFHSPKVYAPGDAEMDLAAAILSDGISSRLYQELIYKNKLATDVSAYQESMMLGSLFRIEVTAADGVSLDDVEKKVDEAVAAFLKDGPTADELERQKSKLEYDAISSLQSIMAKADRLNAYEFHFGEPNSFKRDLDRYRKATREGVTETARKVLTADARLIMRVLPEPKKAEVKAEAGGTGAAKPGSNKTAPVEDEGGASGGTNGGTNGQEKAGAKGEGEKAAQAEPPKREPGARDQRPTIGEDKDFAAPLPETFALSNGVMVHHWRRPELPLMETMLIVNGGSEFDGPEKMGLATLTAEMLGEGAGERGAVEFSDAVDLLGADFGAAAGVETSRVSLSSLTRNYEKALALFADAVVRPRFDDKEWTRVQKLQVEALQARLDQPAAVAAQVALRTFFGDGHPYGRPLEGTPDSVRKLALGDLKGFHQMFYDPNGATILTAGDLTQDQVKETLEKALAVWKGKEAPAKPAEKAKTPDAAKPPRVKPNPTDPAGTTMGFKPNESDPMQPGRPAYPQLKPGPFRVAVVDRPGAVQTVVRFMMPGTPYADPKRPTLNLLNTILGGSFTSRLNQNLREDKGYTYGARSGFVFGVSAGYLTANSAVRADVTGASIKEFMKEFTAIRGGNVTDVETNKARATVRLRTIQAYETLGGLLGEAAERAINGKPFASVTRELADMKSVSAKTLNELAKDAIPFDRALMVLVGDKKLIAEQLKGMELPAAAELTVMGDPVAAPKE